MVNGEDDNGNRASVAEICKKFDVGADRTSRGEKSLIIEGRPIKISENRFKKQDILDNASKNEASVKKNRSSLKKLTNGERPILNGDISLATVEKNDINNRNDKLNKTDSKIDSVNSKCALESTIAENTSKLTVSNDSIAEENGVDLRGSQNVTENGTDLGQNRNSNHTNHYPSYIFNKDFQKGEEGQGEINVDETEAVEERSIYKNGRYNVSSFAMCYLLNFERKMTVFLLINLT